MMVARVFPRRIKSTPDDPMAFSAADRIPSPEGIDKVVVSATFTWDVNKAMEAGEKWKAAGHENVEVGGPAFGDPSGDFVPGFFLKKGYVITSRGCPHTCDFCLVKDREGSLRELEVKEGNEVLDNNILACSKQHWRTLVEMLKKQSYVKFTGGLQADRITEEVVQDLRDIHVERFFVAYDDAGCRKVLQKAAKLLDVFPRKKKGCFVLIGRTPMQEWGHPLDVMT